MFEHADVAPLGLASPWLLFEHVSKGWDTLLDTDGSDTGLPPVYKLGV